MLFFLGVVWGCGATWGFGALYFVCFWGGLLLGAGGGGVGGVEAGSPSPRANGLAGECASRGDRPASSYASTGTATDKIVTGDRTQEGPKREV